MKDDQQMIDALNEIHIDIRTRRILYGGLPEIEWPTNWSGEVSVGDEDTFPDHLSTPLSATGYRLDASEDLFDALDAPSADTAWFLPLIDGQTHELLEELDLAMPYGDVLVVDRVSVEVEWQHRGGVGRYLTGLMLNEMTAGVSVIALHAHPYQYTSTGTDDEIRAGEARLLEVWGDLGFERFRETQIMTLDPNSLGLTEAIDRLRMSVTSRR